MTILRLLIAFSVLWVLLWVVVALRYRRRCSGADACAGCSWCDRDAD